MKQPCTKSKRNKSNTGHIVRPHVCTYGHTCIRTQQFSRDTVPQTQHAISLELRRVKVDPELARPIEMFNYFEKSKTANGT